MKLVAQLAVVAIVFGFSFRAEGQSVTSLSRTAPQVPSGGLHPTFAGIWTPSDPARSDKAWSVGISRIPGRARLTIEQRPDRLTLTISMPDDLLSSMLRLVPFYPTVVLHLSDVQRSGGYGAGGPPPLSGPTWVGDQLTVPALWPGDKDSTTTTYSLDGDRLKVETRTVVNAAHTNHLEEWFNRSSEPEPKR
jgi:hypothetical protein